MYVGILVGVACAVLFYRAAVYERMSPWVWAISSFALTFIVSNLTSGIALVLMAQAGLFAVMWWYNAFRKGRPKE